MKKLILIHVLLLIGAGLTACSFALHKSIEVKTIPVSNQHNKQNSIDSLVEPYKTSLEKEMNEKIAIAEVNFINERPNGNLGNLVADILIQSSQKNEEKNLICVLNFGGLRSTINQGDVLLSDVYKLLPFDNYLVYVKLKAEIAQEMQRWIVKNGGQPIAGFYIEKNVLLDKDKNAWGNNDFWVVTSDYLLNGGDNATFFQNNVEVIQTNQLLRDVFLNGIRNKVLKDNKEQRIILN